MHDKTFIKNCRGKRKYQGRPDDTIIINNNKLGCDCVDCGVTVWAFSRDGHSVLVHGSDGTDGTLLISTLAQLIMDPCCRTLEGFLALLEREWVQVGCCM